MSDANCENVCIAAMAIADGEKSLLRAERIEAHLVGCANCRREVEQMSAMTRLLDSQLRRTPQENLWTLIGPRINVTTVNPKSQFGWRVFLFLVLPLFGYKVMLMLLERDPGIWFRLIPLLFVIAVFAYLKENPFKINCELTLEGE